MTDHNEDFTQLAKDAGVPTTEAEINAEFDAVRETQGLTVTNTNAFGPFWRFVNAVATTAAKWLIDFVITSVLPQAFVKTASGVFLELHAWAVNLTRKQAVAAIGLIQFSRTDTAGALVVPLGTVIQSTEINGKIYSLQTTLEAQFTDGQSAINVPVEALGTGADYNLAAGYYTVLVDAISGVTSVTNLDSWLTTPGAETELDDDLRDRIRNQYSAVNPWHIDSTYASIIASFEGVTIDNTYFEHDAPRGPGTANAFILLETGNPSAPFIAEIQSEITDKGNHGHGDDLQLFAMPETTHNIAATVWPIANLTTEQKATLLVDVGNFTRAAFRENASFDPTKTQPWATFSFSQLGREMHEQITNLHNVDFDLSHINSLMNIPRIGTLTVAEYV